jgi:hypothetical protein
MPESGDCPYSNGAPRIPGTGCSQPQFPIGRPDFLMFAFPGKVYFCTPAVVLPMLYANTIVAVLNSCFQILKGQGYTPARDVMSAPSFLVRGGGSSGPDRSTIVTIE